jgi:hypothetical protein
MSVDHAKKLRQAQMLFDYRLPAGDFLTPKQVGGACGWDADSIKRAYDEGKILGNHASMSGKDKAKERGQYRIPREWAVLFLASIANYGPDEALDYIVRMVARWDKSLKHQLLQKLTQAA